MNKKENHQMRSIRKKLMAALAMLLVACIMTVSSTYAWFTLSTAPEVKGITTTVGANGNLEIALGSNATYYGNTPVADAMGLEDAVYYNLTWGNLIDLSDPSYGLGDIMLYPSRLNVTNGALRYLNPLKYPSYGSDGRVSSLKDTTFLANFANNAFTYDPSVPSAGVNAIGAAADVSEREFALREYKSDLSSSRRSAQQIASTAINTYGAKLVNVALKQVNATTENPASFDSTDVAALSGLVAELEKANEKIGEALKNAVLATLAAANIDSLKTEDLWKGADNTYSVKTITEIMEDVESNYTGISLPTAFTSTYNKYETNKTKISTAAQDLNNLTGDSYAWEDIDGVVNNLLNTDIMTVNNFTIDALRKDQNGEKSELTKQVASGKGLTVGMPSGSGIFADISDLAGNYTSYIIFTDGTIVEGIDVGGVRATMETKSTYTTSNTDPLEAMMGALASATAPTAGATEKKILVDTYGYALDFWFRTNASDSYLQLQVQSKDRVYSDNANTETMGAGSTMTFGKTQTFDEADVKKLMGAVRVVFYTNPLSTTNTDASILGIATLDTTKVTTVGNDVTAPLHLVEYEFYNNENLPTDPRNGKINIVTALTDNPATAENEALTLTALTANEATPVSVLVYLDGDVADSSYFDISDISMEGKLNLQFSSSADLVPMENSALHIPGTTTTTTSAATTEPSN